MLRVYLFFVYLFWGIDLLIFTPFFLCAQSSFKFKRLTIDEGLSSNYTNTALQTQDGFLWIATDEGVNRFDGYTIKKYYHEEEDIHSINNNYISSFFEDASGQLWIGANSKGFCRYDKYQDHFVRYDLLENSLIVSFFEDSEKNIWVFGTDGVVHINTKTQNVRQISSLANLEITSVCQAPNPDEFWIGLREGGVLLFSPKKNILKEIPKENKEQVGIKTPGVRSLYLDTQGILWIGYFAEGILSAYNTQSKTFTHYSHQENLENTLVNFQVTNMTEYKGQIWVGTENGGISIFNKETQQFKTLVNQPKNPQSLSGNSIAEEGGFYEDRQGRLWIATHFGGLNVLDPNNDKFDLFSKDLPDPVVNAVYADHRQRLWIGTEKGLLKVEGQKSKLYVNAPILTIAQDQEQRIWIGTWGKGLGYYDEIRDQFVMYQHNPQDEQSVLTNNVFSIAAGNDSDIWVGGFVEGISRMSLGSLGKFENYTQFLGEEDLTIVRSIVPEGDKLWLGSVNGLILFDPHENKHLIFDDTQVNGQALTGAYVHCIYKDQKQRIWVGTTDGLNLMREDTTFKHFTIDEGLPNNVINSITEDNQGYLWIATNDGLSRFNPEDLQFRNFDKFDGLQSNQFRTNSSTHDDTGKIYLGGMKGLNIFDPNQIVDNPHIPEVHITGLRIFNQKIKIGDQDSLLSQNIMHTKELTLNHRQSVITLEFVALSFTDAPKNQYAYKLEGFEENWNYVGNQRNATYTNLDAGTYTFRVKASNNDGTWNEEGTSLIIHVLPPWWETWWFRTTLILLGLCILYTFYKLRMRNIQRQKERLEELVSMRTHELMEKNSEVLTQAEEMQQQAEELATQRDYLAITNKELETSQKEIRTQKKELEIKNQRINHSIRAAKTIQQAILPSPQKLADFFPEYFVIYQPKDIVSGDFYWLANIEQCRVLITADCTGHGVSGAIMSIIGKSVLEKVIANEKCLDPSVILEKLHENVRKVLKQKETNNNLGMDLSVIVMQQYNKWLTLLKFAGAKTSLFIHFPQEDKVDEIKGSRRSIGGIQNLNTPFETHQFLLESGSMVYTGSDGYIDQNDKRRKSFGAKAFKKLLLEINDYPLCQQKEILEEKLKAHMQDTQQRDDILLIGYKI